MTPAPEFPINTATMVHEKPADGAFEEVLFGSDRGNTLWIRFSDEHDIHQWIGKFGTGASSVMRIVKAEQPDKFMITAGGFAYLINATTRQLLNHYDNTSIEDVAYDPLRNQFIAADYCFLIIVEDGRELWKSERVALDGINSLELSGRVLTGRAVTGFEGEEEPFSLDLDTRQFITAPNRGYFASFPNKASAKSWWRFWA